VTLIGSACAKIVEDNPDINQRRWALRFRSVSSTAIYDIVTNPDPFTQLIDLLLVVSLQNGVWIDDALADDRFGDRGEHLVVALRKSREEIWKLARASLTPEQMSVLDGLIWNWRKRNPDVDFVSLVRFTDFSDSRGKSLVADARQGFLTLSAVNKAAAEAEKIRELAERMFYVSKRAPILLEWQLELAQTELVAQPEIHSLFENQERIFASIDRIATQTEEMPKFFTGERVAVLKALDAQGTQLRELATEYRGLIREGTELSTQVQSSIGESTVLLEQLTVAATALEKTVLAVDRMISRFFPDPAQPGESQPSTVKSPDGQSPDGQSPDGGARVESESEPFRIGDYTLALAELTTALTEANALLDRTDGLLSDERVQHAIDQMGVSAREVESTGFWSAFALILSFFGCLVVYRTYSVRLRARYRQSS
jgi:hypothetical protein